MTLVILAGGFGTRFGGPKQFMEVGPEDECLLHYTIADARSAGFTDFVLLTREEIADVARERVYPLLPPELKPRMVFQQNPGGKARGTGHAVLSCRGQVLGKFAVCNADDWYGPETFRLAVELLGTQENGDAGMVPFQVMNTLSENGGGSRAKVEAEGERVVRLTELRDVQRFEDGAIRGRTEEGDERVLDEKTPVSMNIFLFDEDVFGRIESYATWVDETMPEREIGLPQFLNREIAEERVTLRHRVTPEKWFGLTFPEDLEDVKERLKQSGPARLRL